MRLLVPAASAALIAAVALPATAAVHNAGARPAPAGAAPSTSEPAGAATDGPTTLAGADTPAANPTRAAPRERFAWPLSPRPAVHRRFEQPRSDWSRGHRGVDLLAAVGQQVVSAEAGVVAFSGVIVGRGVITVRHRGGLRTTYEPVDERLASGTLVSRGTRIGVVSPTPGHCLPLTCLHWGAIVARTYRDPLSQLGLGRPILLPLG